MRLMKDGESTKILMKIDDEENVFSLLLYFRKMFKSLHCYVHCYVDNKCLKIRDFF